MAVDVQYFGKTFDLDQSLLWHPFFLPALLTIHGRIDAAGEEGRGRIICLVPAMSGEASSENREPARSASFMTNTAGSTRFGGRHPRVGLASTSKVRQKIGVRALSGPIIPGPRRLRQSGQNNRSFHRSVFSVGSGPISSGSVAFEAPRIAAHGAADASVEALSLMRALDDQREDFADDGRTVIERQSQQVFVSEQTTVRPNSPTGSDML